MYFFTKYTYQILDQYRDHLPVEDTIAIGFTGVANERPAPASSNPLSNDVLIFGATVNFNNAGVLVRIRSISPQYEWMADITPTGQDTPVNAIAGVFSQALPVLPLVQPFFLMMQGRIQMQFTNAAAAPITGGLWTWRGLRLVNPIDGGWNYARGFSA